MYDFYAVVTKMQGPLGVEKIIFKSITQNPGGI
jgi:hypothetical protein